MLLRFRIKVVTELNLLFARSPCCAPFCVCLDGEESQILAGRVEARYRPRLKAVVCVASVQCNSHLLPGVVNFGPGWLLQTLETISCS